jgi:hypothetical protein
MKPTLGHAFKARLGAKVFSRTVLVDCCVINSNSFWLYIDLKRDTKQGEATDDVHADLPFRDLQTTFSKYVERAHARKKT